MPKEKTNLRQIDGEPFRRWFYNDEFDLILWHSSELKIVGFQLCYNKDTDEKALTWHERRGFSHHKIDDGESRGGRHKMFPLLVADGRFDADNVLNTFLEESCEIEFGIVDFVTNKIKRYSSQ